MSSKQTRIDKKYNRIDKNYSSIFLITALRNALKLVWQVMQLGNKFYKLWVKN